MDLNKFSPDLELPLLNNDFMFLLIEEAIIKTLIYADLFDYPLTENEIYKRLIVEDNNTNIKRQFKKDILFLDFKDRSKIKEIIRNSKFITKKKKLYCLKGREKIIAVRKERERFSQKKIEKARRISAFLKIIPTVKLIGISGALAINNADLEDDIDLVVVSSAKRLWITRFLTTFLIELLGKRRHPQDRDVRDKFCLNMYFDENYLAIPKIKRDLYCAYEVLQMKVIYSKDNTYQKFLFLNNWVTKFLPNFKKIENLKENKKDKKRNSFASYFNFFIGQFFNLLEYFLQKLQIWYMSKNRTKELITKGIIGFHPHDARIWILNNYQNRLKEYKLNLVQY